MHTKRSGRCFSTALLTSGLVGTAALALAACGAPPDPQFPQVVNSMEFSWQPDVAGYRSLYLTVTENVNAALQSKAGISFNWVPRSGNLPPPQPFGVWPDPFLDPFFYDAYASANRDVDYEFATFLGTHMVLNPDEDAIRYGGGCNAPTPLGVSPGGLNEVAAREVRFSIIFATDLENLLTYCPDFTGAQEQNVRVYVLGHESGTVVVTDTRAPPTRPARLAARGTGGLRRKGCVPRLARPRVTGPP